MRKISRRRAAAAVGTAALIGLGLVLFLTVGSPGRAHRAGGGASGPQPPSSIAANCSKDESEPMQQWLSSLPPGTTVRLPAQSCYEIDRGIRLGGVDGLAVIGGHWHTNENAVTRHPRPVFWFVGGRDIRLDSLAIVGTNRGGYHRGGAFESAIRSDGVDGFTVSHTAVQGVFGDGIELNVERGANDNSGTIVADTRNATISDDTIVRAGRQAVTMSGVAGARLTDLVTQAIGINVFDLEADQGNEGATDVVIDGCNDSGGDGGLFFANGGGGGGGAWTHDVTVENCSMKAHDGGDAIYVQNVSKATSSRGPFTFVHDDLWCGASDYVACIQLTGASVTVENSTFHFPSGTVHEALWHLTHGSHLNFTGTTASGFGTRGVTDSSSSVAVDPSDVLTPDASAGAGA